MLVELFDLLARFREAVLEGLVLLDHLLRLRQDPAHQAGHLLRRAATLELVGHADQRLAVGAMVAAGLADAGTHFLHGGL